MNRLVVVSLVALLGLAGCASTQINQPPVPYTATKVLSAVGNSVFTVRTYTRVGNKRSELSGVPCTFQGDGFKSSFTTPAQVMSPNMQGRTPPASVSCTYEGQTQTRPLAPYNKTLAEINSSAMGYTAAGGLVGVLVGAGVAAVQASSRDVNQDVYGYPDVQVNFGG